jgi:hypothetical protein
MRGRTSVLRSTWWLLPIIFGCTSIHAPPGWPVRPGQLPTEVYGGWLEIRYSPGAAVVGPPTGELIAVAMDTVFVADDAGLHAVAAADAQRIRLVTYHPDASLFGSLAVAGALSTITHGALAVFTAPMWLLAGGGAAGARSREPIIDYPSCELGAFTRWARFPQGLPAGVDRSQVRMKVPLVVGAAGWHGSRWAPP